MSVGAIADWASILSLIIVIFNAYQITGIRRRIVLNLTLEPLLERFRDISRRMEGYLPMYAASAESFEELIGPYEANVRAVQRRFGAYRNRFCRPLLSSIRKYRRQRGPGSAQRVYADLQGVIQEISNQVEERRIRP